MIFFFKIIILGAKDFVIWTLPQVQYHNPKMQILTFLNQTPTPFVTCYLKGNPHSRKMDNTLEEIHFDVEGQTKEEILERLQKTLGQTEEEMGRCKIYYFMSWPWSCIYFFF